MYESYRAWYLMYWDVLGNHPTGQLAEGTTR